MGYSFNRIICTTMAFNLYYLVCILGMIIIHYVEPFDRSDIEKNVKLINSMQSLWKAEFDPVNGVDSESWKSNLGISLDLEKLTKLATRWNPKELTLHPVSWLASLIPTIVTPLPENFDLREAWPACKSLISSIRNQGQCASCWAVTLASVLSDRFCIASNGTYNLPLSAEDIMRCCDMCTYSSGNPCLAGDLAEAFKYLQNEGIVTGGEYGSKKGCKPYLDYSMGDPTRAQCQKKCSNRNYKTYYDKDKHKMKEFYWVEASPKMIKKELMNRGSCFVIMELFEDFKVYTKGIYRHLIGGPHGLHAVRLIGWGRDDKTNTEYWLAANSWGDRSFKGDKGILKINVDSNFGFEKRVIGVVPTINK